MNRKLLTIILIALLATLLSVGGAAGQGGGPGDEVRPQKEATTDVVNSRISYQGKLTEDGVPVNGNRNMTFRLYTEETCGSLLWPPIIKGNVPISDGLFSVALDVTHDHFDGQGLWLGVEVAGTTVIDCQEVLPVPYALSLRPGAVISDAGSKIQLNRDVGDDPYLYNYKHGIEAEVVGGSYDYVYGVCGVAGTTETDGIAYGLFGSATADSGTAYGVHGESESIDGVGVYGTAPHTGVEGHASADSSRSYGVYGQSDSTGGRGVYGYTSAHSGATYGVYGVSKSDEGRGVYGYATAFTGATYGVFGESNSSAGTGVYGVAPGTGVYGVARWYGVQGRADATSGATYGVYGESRSAEGAGVYATNRHSEGTAPDLVLGGTSGAGDYDDGRIHSEPTFLSSDLLLVSNDDVSIYLNSDGGSSEDSDLEVFDQDNNRIFNVDESGTTQVKVLEITGGSDLAEPFEIAGAESIAPGMVVAIDPQYPGQLRIADQAYDRTVAGCVSGANGINPGLTMQQEGTVAEGSLPVALSGRVYCWADASYGSIQPGDLLTTSDTPGHAMEMTDYQMAQGAIIGKAMSSLDEGRGLVLVLVSLQ